MGFLLRFSPESMNLVGLSRNINEKYSHNANLLWSWEKYGEGFHELRKPLDVCFMENGRRLVYSDYYNYRLHVLDIDGRPIMTLSGKDEKIHPESVAVNKYSGQVAVTDSRSRCIWTFDLRKNRPSKFAAEIMFKPNGICVTEDHHYVVTDIHDCSVNFFDSLGVFQKKWYYQFPLPAPGLPACHGQVESHHIDDGGLYCSEYGNSAAIASDSHDRILICTELQNCVKIFNQNGDQLGEFSSSSAPNRRNQCTQLCQPKGICVDKCNNVIICDSGNNKVDIYSPQGQFVQNLVSENKDFIVEPRGVALDDKGHLAVASYEQSKVSCFHIYQT